MSQFYTVLGNVLVHHDLPVIVDLCSAGCTQLVVLVEHTKLESLTCSVFATCSSKSAQSPEYDTRIGITF